MNRYELHHGDNRAVLKTMLDNSIDSIVCDPPYELGFMGKRWDASGIAYDTTLWTECLRVLKPGGHLVAFGGTRTYHRMTVAIEDAGFEIRDSIIWMYGSGFPKSLDVSKAIDKNNKDDQLARRLRFTAWVRSTGLTASQIDKATGTNMGSHYTTQSSQPAIMTRQHLDAVRHLIGDVPDWVETEVDIRTTESEAWKAREVVGKGRSGTTAIWSENGGMGDYQITAPHLDSAKEWHGYGTAIKPAHEPAVLARKPLTGTVADNVLTWGVGALNIDGCRVGYVDESNPTIARYANVNAPSSAQRDWVHVNRGGRFDDSAKQSASLGRWPANVILDEHAAEALDEQSDAGASRFFYIAKASRAEREAGLDAPAGERACTHPTVKPIALMRYLMRLVTPKGGTVCDPFMGSGSTGCAAMLEGMRFVGIDITAEYVDIAERRIQHWLNQNPMEL
jgi:DNA modification methylase